MDEQFNGVVNPGKFLRKIRENKGKTQKEVWVKLGCMRSNYISRIEHGKIYVSCANIGSIARAYELTESEKKELEKLADQPWTEEEKNELLRARQTRLELEVLYQLAMLPEEARERVIKAAIAYGSSPK